MARRKRFRPRYKGPVEGWVVNYLNHNYWRVENTYTREEMFQEAQLLFHKLTLKYPKVDKPRWFMSLYITAFTNLFIKIALRDTRCRKPEILVSDVVTFGGQPDVNIEDLSKQVDYNYGFISVMIDEAPEEVRSVLSLMLDCPSEMLELLTDMWKEKGKKKCHGNEFLCEVLGYDPDETDLVKAVIDYFK